MVSRSLLWVIMLFLMLMTAGFVLAPTLTSAGFGATEANPDIAGCERMMVGFGGIMIGLVAFGFYTLSMGTKQLIRGFAIVTFIAFIWSVFDNIYTVYALGQSGQAMWIFISAGLAVLPAYLFFANLRDK